VNFSSHRRGINAPPVNFQAGMQQPGILQPAEPDSLSIGHRARRFTESTGRAHADGARWQYAKM
jgi:hypothetical protein